MEQGETQSAGVSHKTGDAWSAEFNIQDSDGYNCVAAL